MLKILVLVTRWWYPSNWICAPLVPVHCRNSSVFFSRAWDTAKDLSPSPQSCFTCWIHILRIPLTTTFPARFTTDLVSVCSGVFAQPRDKGVSLSQRHFRLNKAGNGMRAESLIHCSKGSLKWHWVETPAGSSRMAALNSRFFLWSTELWIAQGRSKLHLPL